MDKKTWDLDLGVVGLNESQMIRLLQSITESVTNLGGFVLGGFHEVDPDAVDDDNGIDEDD